MGLARRARNRLNTALVKVLFFFTDHKEERNQRRRVQGGRREKMEHQTFMAHRIHGK